MLTVVSVVWVVQQAEVRNLQLLSIVLAVTASGQLVWTFRLGARSARRQRQGTDRLRQANEQMEAQVETSAAALRDSHAAHVRMEQQLREQASLAKLGEMAAVIAHEVRNPLAGVRGAIQIIGTRLPKGSKDAAIATEIVSRIDALNELMKDLLLFARPPQPKLAVVDIGALVTATADLLGGDPAFEQVEVRVGGAPARALGDAALLKIVFVNLLVNAAHAMKGRGTIHVSLTSIADRCQIAFTDAGPGIPAEMLEKVFTPFFTTKARGSGLGLPTVRRLIEAHQGTISVACPSAGGTVVTLQLPGERPALDCRDARGQRAHGARSGERRGSGSSVDEFRTAGRRGDAGLPASGFH